MDKEIEKVKQEYEEKMKRKKQKDKDKKDGDDKKDKKKDEGEDEKAKKEKDDKVGWCRGEVFCPVAALEKEPGTLYSWECVYIYWTVQINSIQNSGTETRTDDGPRIFSLHKYAFSCLPSLPFFIFIQFSKPLTGS